MLFQSFSSRKVAVLTMNSHRQGVTDACPQADMRRYDAHLASNARALFPISVWRTVRIRILMQ
jgi:hypothetical protein